MRSAAASNCSVAWPSDSSKRPRVCWLDFMSCFLDELLVFRRDCAAHQRQNTQAPCDFLGLRAIGVLLLFPVALHFAEAQFEVAEH